MANWAKDFALGMESGLTLGDRFRQGQLRNSMSDLAKRKLEQTEDGQYKYGDQTFGFAPTPDFLAAQDLAEAAKLQMQYGDTDKAIATRADAAKSMSAAIAGMARRAYANKDPQAMAQLYTLYNNGYNARLEPNPDGTLRVMHFPDANPDQAEEVFAGDPQAILDWGMNLASPELFDEITKSRLTMDSMRHQMLQGDRNYALQRDEFDLRRLEGDRSYGLQRDSQDLQRQRFGWEQFQGDRSHGLQQQNLGLEQQRLGQTQQAFEYGIGKDALNFATKYGDAPMIEQNLRRMGLGSEGGGPVFTPNVMRWKPLVEQAAQTTGVPVQLGLAVIQAESAGDPLARSRANASGLMQLMPGTAGDLGVGDATDPNQNIPGGMRYLAQQLKRYNGNIPYALAAYNMGPGDFDKYLAGKIPMPAETKKYVDGILKTLRGGSGYGQTAQQMYEERQAKATRGLGGGGVGKLPGGLAPFDDALERQAALDQAKQEYKDAPNSDLVPERADEIYQERLNKYIRSRNQMGLGAETGQGQGDTDLLTALAAFTGIDLEEL